MAHSAGIVIHLPEPAMLIQILAHKPEMIGSILTHTPTWVWGLLVALLGLGASQLVARTASLGRVAVMPVFMIAFAIQGMVSAFGSSGQLAGVLGVWLAFAAAVPALSLGLRTPSGTRYDAVTRSFHLPGSWVPLVLILGLFVIKYAVGVELGLQPGLSHDAVFGIAIAAVYGIFNGIFTTRVLRLVRLAAGTETASREPSPHAA
jgi:hypothetical protein